MAETYKPTMNAEEFLEWQFGQDERYELVDGHVVKLMAGATEVHDRLVTNIIVALGNQLRGKPCRVATAALAVKTGIRSFRRGDVLVTCGPIRENSTEATDPRLIVEVMSKSNTGIDWQRKLDEYRRRRGLAYILLVDSRFEAATLYVRGEADWQPENADALDHVFQLPEISCTLAMRDIYEDLDLPTTRADGEG